MSKYAIYNSLDEVKRAVEAGHGEIKGIESVVIAEVTIPKKLLENVCARRPNIVVCLADSDERAEHKAVQADDGRHVLRIMPVDKSGEENIFLLCIPVFKFALKRVYPLLRHANQAKDLIPLLAKCGHGTKFACVTAKEVWPYKPKKKVMRKTDEPKESTKEIVEPESLTDGNTDKES